MEFNRLVTSAINYYEYKINLKSSNSEDNVTPNEFSIEKMKEIIFGLQSERDEIKLRYLSIAFGNLTILKKGTKFTSLLLYKEGKSVADIAKERNLTFSTIEEHLSYFVGTGEIDIDELVPVTRQEQVKDVIAKFGDQSPRTLIENLPKGFTYGEIRIVIASTKPVL